MTVQILSDHALARRLERTEATACASFVEQRAIAFPDSGATWVEVAGTYAMFDTPDSPITQSFGLGMFEPPADDQMDKLETFFRERGSPPFHEVSPLADKSTPALLSRRGYEPFEFTSVMYLPLPVVATAPPKGDLVCRVIGEHEAESWARLSVRGWSEYQEYLHIMLDLARLNATRKGGVSFQAELAGEPIATGALSIHEGVALLAGASTVPEARNKGAQGALLHARLQHAGSVGCNLAMMCAEPGSASQRNAERHGFRIAYTRMKWRLRT
jgi:GNAT superfamily N-acetyltransferase